MSGEVAAIIHDEKTAREIVDDLMAEAEAWGSLNLQQMAEANATRGWKQV